MQVFCYMNLHRSKPGKPVYSVMDAKTRRVIAWEEEISLTDVQFKVSEAGRQRVLREKRKNVHAVVRGTLVPSHLFAEPAEDMRAATYNPYKYDSFVDRETEEKLERATLARLSNIGLEYVA